MGRAVYNSPDRCRNWRKTQYDALTLPTESRAHMDNAELVKSDGQLYALESGTYWHLTEPNRMMLHNAYLAEGMCHSISAISRMPGLESAVSPYALRTMSDHKEAAWETARISIDNHLPSRRGAIFLFNDEAVATEAMHLWFPKEVRCLVEARIVRGAKVHKADAKLLDCLEPKWTEHATKYWRGEATKAPLIEVLVDGTVYFPGWQRPPFGLMTPN